MKPTSRIIMPEPRNQLIVDLFKGVMARRLGISKDEADELSRDMVQALLLNFPLADVRS
jgi:hypothetical protein